MHPQSFLLRSVPSPHRVALLNSSAATEALLRTALLLRGLLSYLDKPYRATAAPEIALEPVSSWLPARRAHSTDHRFSPKPGLHRMQRSRPGVQLRAHSLDTPRLS